MLLIKINAKLKVKCFLIRYFLYTQNVTCYLNRIAVEKGNVIKTKNNVITYFENLTYDWYTPTTPFWKKFVRNLFWNNTFDNWVVAFLLQAIVYLIVGIPLALLFGHCFAKLMYCR